MFSLNYRFFFPESFLILILIALGACTSQESVEIDLESIIYSKTGQAVEAEQNVKHIEESQISNFYPSHKGAINLYRLKSRDELNVFIYDEPELSRIYTLDSSGSIILPLAGSLEISGLTLSEAKEAIIEAYKEGYLIRPDVTLELMEKER